MALKNQGVRLHTKALNSLRKGEISPLYIFVGAGPVTRPVVREFIDLLLPHGTDSMNLEVIRDDCYSDGRVLEVLETRPMLPGRKVVLMKDPPFLLQNDNAGSQWKKVFAALRSSDDAKAARMASRIMGRAGVEPSDISGLSISRAGTLLGIPRGEMREPIFRFIEAHKHDIEPRKISADARGEKLIAWLENHPDAERAVMIIETDAVDRRSRMFRTLKELGTVIDYAPSARGAKAGSEQVSAMVRGWLDEEGKRMDSRALGALIERVGMQDLAALQTEVQKLAALSGRREAILLDDVQVLATRHREELLYELTDSLGKGLLAESLESLGRLLDQGVHPVAVLKTLSKFFKRVLLVRTALERGPGMEAVRGLSFNAFKTRILPALTDGWEGCSLEFMRGLKPYALFMLSRQASRFPTGALFDLLESFPHADFALKGGHTPARTVLESIILKSTGRNRRQQ